MNILPRGKATISRGAVVFRNLHYDVSVHTSAIITKAFSLGFIDYTFRGVASWWGGIGGTPSILIAVTLCVLLPIRVFMNLKGVLHMKNMINVLIDVVIFLKSIGPLLVMMLPS